MIENVEKAKNHAPERRGERKNGRPYPERLISA